jgi:hypothetical protein
MRRIACVEGDRVTLLHRDFLWRVQQLQLSLEYGELRSSRAPVYAEARRLANLQVVVLDIYPEVVLVFLRDIKIDKPVCDFDQRDLVSITQEREFAEIDFRRTNQPHCAAVLKFDFYSAVVFGHEPCALYNRHVLDGSLFTLGALVNSCITVDITKSHNARPGLLPENKSRQAQ